MAVWNRCVVFKSTGSLAFGVAEGLELRMIAASDRVELTKQGGWAFLVSSEYISRAKF